MDDNTVLLVDFDGCYAVVGAHFCQTGQRIGWGFMGIYGSAGTVEITGLDGGTAYPAEMVFGNVQAAVGFEAGSYRASLPDSLPPFVTAAHAELEEAHVWADIVHLVDCIRHNRQPLASGEHARHVIEIIEMGYEAARTGRAQAIHSSFSLETEEEL
jgi:predicted dehydrogenase